MIFYARHIAPFITTVARPNPGSPGIPETCSPFAVYPTLYLNTDTSEPLCSVISGALVYELLDVQNSVIPTYIYSLELIAAKPRST